MRIAYIEDNPTLLRTVADGLRKAGYAVDCADNGEDGLWLVLSDNYDVVILDIMLPGLDGLQVLQKARKQGIQTHIILLTARDAVPDRVLGLQRGADDYLVKPFAFDELLARVEALTRRQYGVKSPVLCVADLEMDRARREVKRGGHAITLTPREYALLELLALRAGEVITRTEIERHIYDEQVSPMSNVVDTAVYSLRRKLGEPRLVQTVRGHGYALRAEEEQ